MHEDGNSARASREEEKHELYVELYQGFAAAFDEYVRPDQKVYLIQVALSSQCLERLEVAHQ